MKCSDPILRNLRTEHIDKITEGGGKGFWEQGARGEGAGSKGGGSREQGGREQEGGGGGCKT